MAQQVVNQDELKRAAARSAVVQYVRSGMVVGLGSGSTAEIFVDELAQEINQANLSDITGVATSERVAQLAQTLGITVVTLDEVTGLDVTIDGTDEVEPKSLALTKGRGGALLREKLVAVASKLVVIIADESKLVTALGQKMPLPVEVIPFGWQHTATRLRALDCEPVLRLKNPQEEQPYLTDSHNYILDCRFAPIADPVTLAAAIKSIVGVVEHGLFLGIAGQVIIAAQSGVYEVKS
ncbi:MAG: ribose-5-phosphate isomerase RpiA [Chloroflexota bacterium]|nr:ribose-5-phosphate isomerase RpiA [Chloroflexota bacterium]